PERAPAPSRSAEDTAKPAEPAPSPSETDRNVLEQIGDAIKDVFTPKDKAAEASPSPSADGTAADDPAAAGEKTAEKATEKPTAPEKAAEKAAGAAGPEAEETPTPEASATPSPSPSETSTTDLEDCPVATDAEGGVDNKVPLPDDPWFLNASSLLLKGADYKGIVQVRTANGT